MSDQETIESEEQPSALRKNLEKANADNKRLSQELAALKGRLTVHDAGLSHLSSRQQKVLLREAAEDTDGEELSADTLKEVAKELGYRLTAKKDASSEQASDQPDPESEPESEEQPEDDESLDMMAKIQKSVDAALTPTARDFQTKLEQAKSQEEIMALIDNEGGKVGLFVDYE